MIFIIFPYFVNWMKVTSAAEGLMGQVRTHAIYIFMQSMQHGELATINLGLLKNGCDPVMLLIGKHLMHEMKWMLAGRLEVSTTKRAWP